MPLKIETTPQFSRRQTEPFRLELIDTSRGLRIWAFMDTQGLVRTVEVATLHPSLPVVKLLFRGTSELVAGQAADAHTTRRAN